MRRAGEPNGRDRTSSAPPRKQGRPPDANCRRAPRGDGSGGRHPSGAGDGPGEEEDASRLLRQSFADNRTGQPRLSRGRGGCSGLVTEGHRVVQPPCGHPTHARCVVTNLERGGERSLFQCQAAGCGAQHPRQQILDAAVQADPGRCGGLIG